ncbi:FRIGIDA [Striga asiatica]|uniref:FRIGIDA-like protein n=1 Tax=Striga asiatica TaxID=4170 RepID=A0A5A7QUB6_STRAF|nr:FRIGIDA [Striga asiatica]
MLLFIPGTNLGLFYYSSKQFTVSYPSLPMATAGAITPPLLTSDANPSAAAPFLKESQHLTLTHDDPSATSHPDESESLTPPVPKPAPLFINSISDLKDLSAAISSFQQCYEDLHNHLDSIKIAISSKLPQETPQRPPDPCPSEPAPNPDVYDPAPTIDVAESSPRPDASDATVLQKQEEPNPLNSELEGLCKTMCSRGVRKYLVTHLPNLTQLREEVPKALKLAPKPPKLVLECLGKFYLQGSRAFTRNSTMIPAREASIFVLECFLLMMGKENGPSNVEKAVRLEAEEAALAWRKRMAAEGGLAQANQIDARGLLLFVACFGIPNSFKRDDIKDLVAAANAKEIAGVLQMSQCSPFDRLWDSASYVCCKVGWFCLRNGITSASYVCCKVGWFCLQKWHNHPIGESHLLMVFLCYIVERMLKHKMEVEAVDLIYTFGLQERFNPQNVLVSYLQQSTESWGKGSQTSTAALKEANKKQLSTLKSIRKCLERHNIDPAQLLPDWQINEKITTLEKDIATKEDKWAHKRKPSESETTLPKKPKNHEPKRPRYNNNISHGQQQHRADSRTNNSSRHHVSNSKNNNIYPASTPVVYGGPGAGLLPESMGPPRGSTVQYADTYPWHMDERYGNGGQSSAGGMGIRSLYAPPPAPPVVEGFARGIPSVGQGSDLYQFADSVESNPYGDGGRRVTGAAAHTTYRPPYLYQG